MKMEPLPKVFAATFVVILIVLFQFGELPCTSAPLLGGFFKNTHNLLSCIRKELPATSMQTFDQVSFQPSAQLPFIETETATLPPELVVVDESIAVFDAPDFYELVASVTNGDPTSVRAIYIPDILANEIVQQPKNNWAYVSDDPVVTTEFQSARSNGVTGLLAHNYLLGEQFYEIDLGQYLAIIYGDGSIRRYQVTGIYQFEKLNQSSLTSDFVDLETGERETSTTIFNRFYSGGDKVTLQTCLLRYGQPSWGLTFFVAEPVP